MSFHLEQQHLEQQHPDRHASGIERDQCAKSNLLLNLLAAGFLLIACAVTAFTIYLTFILQWQGPFRDLWEFVDDIERQFNGQWSWQYLLEAYGGAHRIFLPKLLFFADYFWLGGRNLLTMSTALLCQFFYLAVIVYALHRELRLTTATRVILAASFLLALFSTTQIYNFLYAMDVQWHMSNLFGLISLYALARSVITGKYWLLFLFSGTLAALCNFTGLMVFPVAALVLLTDRSANSWRLPLLVIIAAICLSYVSHEKNSQQFVFSALQQSPDWQVKLYIALDTLQKMIPYMMRYLASPLSRDWLTAGYCLASAGTILTAHYWILLIRDGKQLSHLQRFCLYLSTTIIASAFFTAFGRIIYPNSATAERYQTLVLPWLPALYGMIWPSIRDRQHSLIASVSWIISFSVFLLPSQMGSARDMVVLSSRVNQAHTAARAGVLDQPYITATLSYPLIKNGINSVKDNDKFLRSHSLGYFQHLPQFALDKIIEIDHSLTACTGYMAQQIDVNTSSLTIDGRLLHQNKPATDIILLQNNKVIGLGTLVGSDESLLPPARQAVDNSRFRAFMRADRINAGETQVALGILNHEPVCQYPLNN